MGNNNWKITCLHYGTLPNHRSHWQPALEIYTLPTVI